MKTFGNPQRSDRNHFTEVFRRVHETRSQCSCGDWIWVFLIIAGIIFINVVSKSVAH